MKYIKYLFLFMLAILQLTGCKKDFLDRSPKDAYSDATFWKSAEEAQAAIRGCYTNWENPSNILYNDCLTDNAVYSGAALAGAGAGGGNYESFVNGQANSSTDLPINYDYRTIYACNWFLENVDRASSDVLADATKKQLKGEARFLRAYRYFILSQFYRNVPLELHTITQQESRLQKPANQQLIRETILSELAAIAPDLPLSYSNPADKGRITRGAALALKARVELYMGKYPDCIATCNQLKSAPFNYALYPSFEDLFRPQFEAVNNEVILDVQSTIAVPNFSLAKSSLGTLAITPVGGSSVAVTQSLVDAFELTNGKTIQDASYDPLQPYQGRDPRLDATVIRPGLFYNGIFFDPITPPGGGGSFPPPGGGGSFPPPGGGGSFPPPGGSVGGSFGGPPPPSIGYTLTSSNYKRSTFPANSPTGYNFKKYLAVLNDYWNTAYGQTSLDRTGGNVIVIRYAEVLLMFAEAKIEAGQIDASVYDAINTVRQRAGMPIVTASDYPDQASLRTLVRRERRVELAGEGLRWFDIVRWQIGPQAIGNVYDCLDGTVDQMSGNLMLTPGSSTVQAVRQFSSKYYVFPFKPEWLQSNKNLVQNVEYQ
jgi:hypothetical protein